MLSQLSYRPVWLGLVAEWGESEAGRVYAGVMVEGLGSPSLTLGVLLGCGLLGCGGAEGLGAAEFEFHEDPVEGDDDGEPEDDHGEGDAAAGFGALLGGWGERRGIGILGGAGVHGGIVGSGGVVAGVAYTRADGHCAAREA